MSSTMLGRVLVVDDEFQLLDALVEALNAQGYEAHGFQTGIAAIVALQSQEFDLLLTDLMMPGMDGVTLLKACMSIDSNLVGIIMTGQGTVATAVEAMRSGAFDYVLKPFRLEVLLPVLARASEVRRLRLENIQLRETVAIYNLSQTIALSLDAKLVLENTADAALQQTSADEVSIMLLRSENNELYVAVVRGRDREYLLGQHISMQESIAAWVARQSEPLILNGEVSDPRFAPVQPRPEILSAISIPMMTAGKLIGVLNVNNLQARRPFTAGQVKALSILTSAAAAAVENDALFHALEASEKRFRSLIENAPDGIALLGLDGKLQQVTLSTQQILGYTLEEAIGQDPALLTHPDDLPNLLGLLNDLIQNPGKVIHTEYRFRHKDGSWRWLESTISNLISEPSVAAIVFNYRDISKRKQAEQALQESETRFRSLIENSSDEISIVSADGSLLYESPSAKPTLGYQPGEFLGKNLFQLVHPDDQARIQREFEELLHDPTLHPRDRFRLLHNNGTWRWVEVLGTNLLDEPSVRGIVVNYHDVTDRVHVEEQIQYQALIAENVLDAVVATNNEGIIKSWNKAAEGMFGYSGDEVIGKLATSVMNSEYISAGPQEVSAALRDTGSWKGEVRVFRKDGRVVYSVASVSIIWDNMGKDLGYLSVNHDITERKQAEEQTQLQLQRIKALRAIDLAISSSFDLRLTLDIMLDQFSTQLKTDAAAILLFHPSTRTLEHAASRGFRSTAIRETRLRLGEGYAGKAILERRMIHIPNLMETDSEFVQILMLKSENFIEYYCVPLIVKGEVKGVLEIFHRSVLAGGSEWLDFLETLAGQAAIAIENSILFEDLQHSNNELFQAYDATIEGWSHALDLRDKETEGHTLRVTEMTLKLAHKFDFSDEQLRHIRWGALLHDIGKMGVPDNILLKPGKLTDEEWEIMKQHPVFALEMLSPITYLKSSLDIPYCHHEKWDGTGYPRGLKGDVIPLAARLFAIVDVWDALRSDRPYRKAWSVEKTIEHIKFFSGTHFDPQVVEHFLGMIERAN